MPVVCDMAGHIFYAFIHTKRHKGKNITYNKDCVVLNISHASCAIHTYVYTYIHTYIHTYISVDALWDLKGCADDKIVRQGGASVPQVHKRWYMLHWLAAEGCGDCGMCMHACMCVYVCM